ncbi:hypothetical protein [Bifidobacterium sp. ESL0790]|uniref:hypothetical protein n=1 Tax=Bifidobacterium sp. ESL0790 TaxID=2983233 RepID=UPI0023F88D50|nr:hypothetical protein [Bifidobacterium sp. ESL0790]WEV73047.1 hypothetical protein OZY47_03630 [Bifidobacterium sp. ESL0790]
MRSSRTYDGGSKERTFYAKLDNISSNKSGYTITFSAINALSKGFWQDENHEPQSAFAIHKSNDPHIVLDDISLGIDEIESNVGEYWESIFNPEEDSPVFGSENDPFKRFSTCSISIFFSKDHLPQYFLNDDNRYRKWYLIKLGQTLQGNQEINQPGTATSVWQYPCSPINSYLLYANYQGQNTRELYTIKSFDINSQMDKTLEAVCGTKNWKISSVSEIKKEISTSLDTEKFEQLICFNVGQGTCIGLADKDGKVLMYSDFGCGIIPNAKTTPKKLRYCTDEHPIVILSHWHRDHWQGAYRLAGRAICESTWILPPVPNSLDFGKSQLVALLGSQKQGRVFLLAPRTSLSASIGINQQPIPNLPNRTQKLHIEPCNGSLSGNPNECGIALLIEDVESQTSKQWILPGDASYTSFINPLPNSQVTAVVAAHHGGIINPGQYPQRPTTVNQTSYARLLFSFGGDNSYGIPKDKDQNGNTSRQNYQAAGWKFVSGWPAVIPSASKTGTDVLSTAEYHTRNKPHRPSENPLVHIAASWDNGIKPSDTHLRTCFKGLKYKILR